MQNIYEGIHNQASQIERETRHVPVSQEKAVIADVIQKPRFINEAQPLSKSSDYLRAAMGWVYSCVSVISDEVANIDMRLYTMGRKGEVKEVFDHPALELLSKANSFTTKFDLFWSTQQYLELVGEAPWLIAKTREGVPTDIFLLRPDFLKVIPGTEGRLVDGYKYMIDSSNEVDLLYNDVIFLRYPDPTTPFRGKGTLSAAAKTVDIDNFSEDFNRSFFYNSAMPGSILKTDSKLTKDTKEFVQHQISRLYKGVDKAHKTMVLEQGLDWKPMQMSQKDMDFLEQQKFSRDKILGIFRVPRTAIGITDDVNRANAEATDYVFAKRTIKPKMQRLVEQLNEFFLPMFPGTEQMFLDFEDPVPDDVEAKTKLYDSALKSGWMTINEIRAIENLPDIGDAGDVPYVPNTLQPVGAATGTPDANAQKMMRRAQKAKLARNKERNQKAVEEKQIVEKVAEKLEPIVKSMLVKKKFLSENEKFQEFWVRKIAKTDSFEKIMKGKMQTIFDKQRAQTLKKLNKKQADVSKLLLDAQAEAKNTQKVMKPVIAAVITEESKNSFEMIGIDEALSVSNPAVQKYLEDETFRFSIEVSEETNKKLGKALSAGVEQGEGIDDLTTRVRELFDEMKRYRAERIARSEVLRASNFATEQSYKESGVVEEKVWMTAFDERVCQWCGPLDGKTVKLGKNFFNKGDQYVGEEGGVLTLDFVGIGTPPLHPNCRCTIIPVLKQ